MVTKRVALGEFAFAWEMPTAHWLTHAAESGSSRSLACVGVRRHGDATSDLCERRLSSSTEIDWGPKATTKVGFVRPAGYNPVGFGERRQPNHCLIAAQGCF